MFTSTSSINQVNIFPLEQGILTFLIPKYLRLMLEAKRLHGQVCVKQKRKELCIKYKQMDWLLRKSTNYAHITNWCFKRR